jgi:hypothetical protein
LGIFIFFGINGLEIIFECGGLTGEKQGNKGPRDKGTKEEQKQRQRQLQILRFAEKRSAQDDTAGMVVEKDRELLCSISCA